MPLIVKAGVSIDPFKMGKGQTITPWRKVLPEKLVILQLVEMFPTFCGTTFTRTCYWSIFCARALKNRKSRGIESIML
jgi:hypothetical protein